ncbi:TadE/TadG family type IV pilus assembly protein [Hamadaea tsunoensis]|uniref:TadE/TadG family type IV pilus assembly protein n=1 Tax=Hamadaea tsunoensis TaxID=53368 RepID=UPI0004215947|nr:hypothetical protein [Hamadaea tsunoensis]
MRIGARRRCDEGRITMFFAILATAWFTMVGLIVVGGGRVRAYQYADNVATEAARSAAQAIDPGPATAGGTKTISPTLAAAAAKAYLDKVGATGTVTVLPGGQSVRVDTQITYKNPSGLEFLGGATWTAEGSATAVLIIR